MKEQSTIWKEYIKNWEIYAYPGRPSEGDIAILKKWLKKINAKRVLVFGSTPELRDLLFELGCETYVIDLQMEMIEGMKQYMKHPNDKENIINADWLDAPLQDDFFDAILGDLILVNIPLPKQPQLFKQIIRMLKKDGYFMPKILYQPDNWPGCDSLKTEGDSLLGINKIASLPYNRNRYEELLVYLMYQVYDYEKKIYDGMKLQTLIEKYYKDGKLSEEVDEKAKKLFDMLFRMWGKPLNKLWYSQVRKEKIEWISKFFVIEEEKCASGYLFAEHFPTLLCRLME